MNLLNFINKFYGLKQFFASDRATENMRITDDGLVGIGTDSPSVELDVVGDASITGNITAGNGDIEAANGGLSGKSLYIEGDAGVSDSISAPTGYGLKEIQVQDNITGVYSDSTESDVSREWHAKESQVADPSLDGTHAYPWTAGYDTGFVPIKEDSASATGNFFLSGDFNAVRKKMSRILHLFKAAYPTGADAFGGRGKIALELLKQTGASDTSFVEALSVQSCSRDGEAADGSADESNVAVFNGSYGGIHCHDGSTAQSIATGTTYTKLTAFTDSHRYNDVKTEPSSDQITIKRAGTYRVNFSISYTSGTNNVTWKIAAFNGTTELDNVHAQTKIGTGTDSQNVSSCGFVQFAASDVITLRARHDQAGSVNITPIYASLLVERVGE